MKKQINLVLLAFCFFFVCVGGYSIYRISAIQAGYAAARKEYIEIQEEYKTEKPAWDFTCSRQFRCFTAVHERRDLRLDTVSGNRD